MKIILRFLKPHKLAIFFIAIILFGQALSDLSLPKVMSNIVNVGIQQDGIEHAAPDYISQQGMSLAKTFMSPDWRVKIDQYYTLGMVGDIDRTRIPFTVNGKELLGADLKIYIKNNNLNSQQIDDLDSCFGDVAWNLIYTMESVSASTGNTSFNASSMDAANINITDLYKMQPMLDTIPQTVLDQAYAKTAQLDPTIKKQTGTVFAGLFLNELGIKSSDMQSNYIWHNGWIMLLLAAISGVCAISVGFLTSRVAAGVSRRTRKRIFEKVLTFSNNEYDNLPTSTLITRATNDIKQVQDFLSMGMRMLLYSPLMIVGGGIMAYQTAKSMTWIIALACAAVIILVVIAIMWIVPKFKLMQKFIDNLNLIVREHLTGIMVIRAFSNRFFEKQRFDKANKDISNNLQAIGIGISTLFPFLMLVMNAVSLLIIWVGAHKIASSTIQVGDMMAFMQYAMQIIMSFMMLSMMFFQLPRAMVSAGRIQEVLSTEPVIKKTRYTHEMNPYEKGIVEFKNVSFRFNGADTDALHDISFVAKPGQTTAIIGSTGSGKSTLVNLMLRYYDPTEGQILMGEEDIKKIDLNKLRDNIGFAPQKGFLFSGDIISNLKLADENASGQRIYDALKISQAAGFVDERIGNNDEEVAQGGGNFSGGQRQRLSIARALVKDAPIYVFDDSFSALDMKTDAELRKALKADMKDKTLFIVAQRISTIKDAEQILVLDEGQIIGKGTHEELLKTCPEYREIAETQGETTVGG